MGEGEGGADGEGVGLLRALNKYEALGAWWTV